MGDVVKLTTGRSKRGAKLPKPVECKECGDPIETARLQILEAASGTDHFVMKPWRCISCQKSWERRFDREMEAVRDWQTVEIKR